MLCAQGTFKPGTGIAGTTASLTIVDQNGVSFIPKAIFMWTAGGNNSGVTNNNVRTCFGAWCTGNKQFANAICDVNGAVTSDTTGITTLSSSLYRIAAGGICEGEGTITSASDGLATFTVGTQFVGDCTVSFIAWGGTEITGVNIASFTVPDTATSRTITGLGINPSVLILASTECLALDSHEDARLMLGLVAAENLSQGVTLFGSKDASVTSVTGHYARSGQSFAGVNKGTTSINIRGSVTDTRQDEFDINLTEANGHEETWTYLAIEGGLWDTGSFTTPTDTTTTFTETGIPLTPKGLLAMGCVGAQSADDTLDAEGVHTVGTALDGPAIGESWQVAQSFTAQATQLCARGWNNNGSTAGVTSAATLNLRGQFLTFTADGFTYKNAVYGAAAGLFVQYLAFGGEEEAAHTGVHPAFWM